MRAVNGRFATLGMSGMERYAREIVVRMGRPRLRLLRPRRRLRGVQGQFWEQVVLPLRMSRGEVLWSPANTGPVAYHPHVVTVHDVAVFDHPEWFSRKVRLAYWAVLPRLIEEADFIATPSEFTRSRVCSRFGVDRQRVRVVRAGFSEEWLWPAAGASDDFGIVKTLAEIMVKPFGLVMGGDDPRKNVHRVVAAWQQVRRVIGELELVIVGSATEKLFRRSAVAGQPWMHFVRGVSDTQLDLLYRAAKVLVFASLYEGCGLPPLEAAARGTAVVVSDIAPLRETLSGVGRFVDPWDVNSIAEGILHAAGDGREAECVVTESLRRAGLPTWDQAAAQMTELLEEASASH